MNRHVMKASAILFAVAAFAVCGPTVARADEIAVAKVPFAFMVHGERMPAGKYVISDDTMDASGVLTIESADGRHVALTTTIASSPEPMLSSWRPTLVFDRFGHHLFLADVDYDAGYAREIPLTSKGMERQLVAAKKG